MDVVPSILLTPLVFGDQSQILALKEWERRIESERFWKENAKEYTVIMHFEGELSVDVKALDVEEAFNIASESSVPQDILPASYCFSLVSVKET